MRVQIFEQFMGGHYTNYIQHLLPALIELKKDNLIDDIIVTITSEHLKSEYFENQLRNYSQWVKFEPCLEYVNASLGLDPRLMIKRPKAFVSSLQNRAKIANNLISSVYRFKPDYLISTTADTQSSLGWAINSFLGLKTLPKNTYAVGIFHYGYSGAANTLVDRIKDFGYGLTWKYSPWARLFVVNPLVYEHIKFLDKVSSLSQRIALAPDPVPSSVEIDKKIARNLLKIPENGRYVGFIGGMDHRVAIPEILEAFSDATSNPTDRLLLAGKMLPEYREIIEENFESLLDEGRLILMDRYLSTEELNLGYCALDIVATIYYKKNNLSANLLKSVISQRPVIVNNFGYTGMMVKRFNNGWACNVLEHKDCVSTFQKGLEECLNYKPNSQTARLIQFHHADNYAGTILMDLHDMVASSRTQQLKTWDWVNDEHIGNDGGI